MDICHIFHSWINATNYCVFSAFRRRAVFNIMAESCVLRQTSSHNYRLLPWLWSVVTDENMAWRADHHHQCRRVYRKVHYFVTVAALQSLDCVRWYSEHRVVNASGTITMNISY